MKAILICLTLSLFISCTEAEKEPVQVSLPNKKDSNLVHKDLVNPYVSTDISPMDVSYFPEDFPVQRMSQTGAAMPVARVLYSRPHRQGRKIFGSLIKYGEPWRLGANEATEIEFFQPVIIQGKNVQRGRYLLYCIPNEKSWTIIFNSNLYSWGLKQDNSKDLFRFEVPTEPTKHSIEYFTMVFQKTSAGADLMMTWDEVQVKLPITI